MAYKYPICDVFHWFCKIARFFATEPEIWFFVVLCGYPHKNQGGLELKIILSIGNDEYRYYPKSQVPKVLKYDKKSLLISCLVFSLN